MTDYICIMLFSLFMCGGSTIEFLFISSIMSSFYWMIT